MAESKHYDPKYIEEKWEKEWIEKDIFSKAVGEEKFSVVIPPPNVTGSLHMGHALNVTLQDIVCRWQRMRGKTVVWVPGFDHAGIATQYVVDKKLQQEGKNRIEIGKEAFLREVWKWVPETRDSIKKQLEKIGVSVDWNRERFTMDEGFSRAVRKAFVELFKEGLIYKDKYIVNWCPKDMTALSDLEVEHEEEKGNLWYIKYPLEDGSGYIVVATTRPETMLGDTAVAVHPQDERYKHLIGKRVKLPLVTWKRKTLDGKEIDEYIPIIGDERVKPEFGTGAVKVTPAHDPNDFYMGKDHNLPAVMIMDGRGVINENGGIFKGLERYEARKKIVESLKEEGLIEKIEEHMHAVGKCYRCKTTVEPLLLEQWFVRVTDDRIKGKAIKVVEEGKIRFIPEQWKKVYLDWMYNLKDWCISRQIWWGHRIPVWYCKDCSNINTFCDDDFEDIRTKIIFNLVADGKLNPEFTKDELIETLQKPTLAGKNMTVLDFYSKWVFGKDISIAEFENLNDLKDLSHAGEHIKLILKCMSCGSENLVQEEDVLDTWFSSALWPFGVFGWPSNTEDLRKFYPTDLLVTGFDIIFFWVARMIMMGLYFMKNIPFKDVYVHALVRDEFGQKMSKTKGNVIDPLDIIDKYGADSLRFTLSLLAIQGRDIKLSEKRFESVKHFANKIWNASRYILMNMDESLLGSFPLTEDLKPEDKWIITCLNKTADKVNRELENYNFAYASQSIYEFFWNEFCDWYIEFTKERIYKGEKEEKRIALIVLLYVLDKALRLLHPFMPFITQEIWSKLPSSHPEYISFAEFPVKREEEIFEREWKDIERLKDIITTIRFLRSDLQIDPGKRLTLFYKADQSKDIVERFKHHILNLARLESLEYTDERPTDTLVVFSEDVEIYLPVEGSVDVEKLLTTYSRKKEEVEKELKIRENKLSNENFLKKAPPHIVEKEKRIKEELEEELEKINRVLSILAS